MARSRKQSLIGIRLKILRRQRELSLRALEEKTGISNAFLSQLETGHAKSISIDNCAVLARALGCCPSWLAFGIMHSANERKPQPVETLEKSAANKEKRLRRS